MKHMVLVGLLAVLATGCASIGDLEALQERVNSLESNHKVIAQEVANCKTQMNALAEKQEHCDKHCKLLESKLDRVFKKSQLK
jgi:hypothetical protein